MTAKRLAIDASVALYFLRRDAPRGQEEKAKQAQRLVTLAEAEWTLCLPTPALAEVLAGVPAPKRDTALDLLTKVFEILVFDLDAARVAADLVEPALRKPRKATKQQLKVDVEIIACAIRWGAAGLCVYDGDHAAIIGRSDRHLDVGPPSRFLPSQAQMFDEMDDRDS